MVQHCVSFRHEIFPEFRNFPDLRGHSRGNPRSDLIFMGGGGGGCTLNYDCDVVYFLHSLKY